jgi:hypothetical protein
MFRPIRGGEVGLAMVEWTIIVLCLGLAVLAVWGVRRLDNPLMRAVVTAMLGSAGAVGLIALPIASAGGAGLGGVVGAGLLLAAVAAPMFWLWLTAPRGWTRPAHGQPAYTNETAAAEPPPSRDPSKYRVRSAAEAIAEAQGGGGVRSARVRRIMAMEV